MATDISELIRSRMHTFSKGQRRIAEAILNDYDKTAYMTAAKLGETAHVSESTVVRFAIELGFSGYPEFQHAVQEMVRTKLTPNQRIEVSSARIGGGDLLGKVMTAEIERIRATMERLDRDAFNSAVDAIVAAKRVYIIGVRSSSTLANFMHFNLSMICDNVRLIQPTSSSEMFEQILDIGEGDVMVAISFPRYSTKIAKAVKYAKASGAQLIAITDSHLSPIAEGADFFLSAQTDMVSFVDSLIAPLSLINALLAAVAGKKPEEVKQRFDKLEHIWDDYDVYAKR